MSNLRWRGPISAWDIGWHWEGVPAGEWQSVARVFQCEKLERLPILPYPSGRRRYLYLAMLRNPGRVVGIYRSLRKAQAACELHLADGPAAARAG